MKVLLIVSLAAALLNAAAVPGNAQSSTENGSNAAVAMPQDKSREQGRRYYQKGLALAEAGRYKEALEWLGKAAKLENADAENVIGMMFFHGLGVKQNDERAKAWLGRAASHGSKRAKQSLTFLTGVPFVQGDDGYLYDSFGRVEGYSPHR